MITASTWRADFRRAKYVYDIVEVEGPRFPTKRRAYLRGPDLNSEQKESKNESSL